MNFEKLMNKKVSKKDFLKSLGFILLALILFPRNALSFVNEPLKSFKLDKKSESENVDLKEVHINGVKVMEIIDE